MNKKATKSFDCFHPVSSKITYFVVIGLFVLFPIAAFKPGLFGLVANDSVISLFDDYHYVIRNLLFIFLLLHLLEVKCFKSYRMLCFTNILFKNIKFITKSYQYLIGCHCCNAVYVHGLYNQQLSQMGLEHVYKRFLFFKASNWCFNWIRRSTGSEHNYESSWLRSHEIKLCARTKQILNTAWKDWFYYDVPATFISLIR